MNKLPSSIAIISNQAFSLINFRGSLIAELASSGATVYCLAPDFTPDSRLQIYNLNAIPIDFSLQRVGLNPFRDSIDCFKLSFLLRKLRPEATLSYFIKPVIFGTIAACIARIPARFSLIEGLGYVFIADRRPVSLNRKILKFIVCVLYYIAFRLSKHILFLNKDDINDLSNAGVLDITKAILIPGIGVNLKHFHQSPTSSLPLTFTFVGRLLREKGVYEFVQAARTLKSIYPHVNFVLVGGTDVNPGSVTGQEINDWERENFVHLTGMVQDVRVKLIEASVFVLPSYREGFPRSTQEAMSVGRAIITTDVPGCRDTVIDGVNGFLVPAKDSVALARAMEKFISNPALIKSMGDASRRIAVNHFDVQIINQRFIDALSLK